MTMTSAVATLHQRLAALDELVRQLGLALEDVPEPGNEPAVVESMRASVADVESDVRIAVESASGGDAAAIVECQQRLNRAWRALESGLASYDTVDEIVRAAGERGGAWPRWTGVVREVVERCQHELYQSADAIVTLGREVVERQKIRV